MSIRIRFFASLADEVGRREAECDFEDGLTVAEVWRRATGQDAPPDGLMCAVNHAYSEVGDRVAENDEVAFFPPVTGG